MQHRFRRAFEKIGKADIKLGLAQANRVVDGDKGIKADVHGRSRCARTHLSVSFLKDFGKMRQHSE